MPLLPKNTCDGGEISDIMTGLMMIFLFIAISFMQMVHGREEPIRDLIVTYQELQDDLYEDLKMTFQDDLDEWGAEIDRTTLSVTFFEPDVLFAQGSDRVREKFEIILESFFPRYLAIISGPKYRNSIEEIRIEGHTSSEWTAEVSAEMTYFLNMALSQGRTRAVLQFCLELIASGNDSAWARQHITANGLSSSQLILSSDGTENVTRSRRVEFRTKTAAETRMVQILEALNP
jgi:outer membrane protein OmpA-like peptidoglycan-associated protein